MRCERVRMPDGSTAMLCGRGPSRGGTVRASKKPLQTKFCESCGASMVFLKSVAGRWMPNDAATVQPGDTHYDPQRHTSHWATCPQPGPFRQARGRAAP
jgi:hypothetical protein